MKMMKMINNNINKVDRLLSDGHKLLGHLGHLRVKVGPGTLRRGTYMQGVSTFLAN
jgi:hypothetical protein